MSANTDLRRTMRELGHALTQAIAASPEAAEAARKIRHQGYSLYLSIDRQEGEDSTRIELTSGQASSAKPDYLLNKGDVSFLESVGIDATRPGRRR